MQIGISVDADAIQLIENSHSSVLMGNDHKLIYDGFFGLMFIMIITTIQVEIDKQENRVYPILITHLLVVLFDMTAEV